MAADRFSGTLCNPLSQLRSRSTPRCRQEIHVSLLKISFRSVKLTCYYRKCNNNISTRPTRKDKARVDSLKPQSNILAVGGALRKPPGTSAVRIEFGFKAPVAMTLTPYWYVCLSSTSRQAKPSNSYVVCMQGSPSTSVSVSARAARWQRHRVLRESGSRGEILRQYVWQFRFRNPSSFESDAAVV